MSKRIILSEEEQIRKCLTCTKSRDECSGECYGLRNSTHHKRTAEEIDALIKQYYSSCETWVDLAERTQVKALCGTRAGTARDADARKSELWEKDV